MIDSSMYSLEPILSFHKQLSGWLHWLGLDSTGLSYIDQRTGKLEYSAGLSVIVVHQVSHSCRMCINMCNTQ